MTIIALHYKEKTDLKKRKSEILDRVNGKTEYENDKILSVHRFVPICEKATYLPPIDIGKDIRLDRQNGWLENDTYSEMTECIEHLGSIYADEEIIIDLAGFNQMQSAAIGAMAQFFNITIVDSSKSEDPIKNNIRFVHLSGTAWYVLKYLFDSIPEQKSADEITRNLYQLYPGDVNHNTIRQSIVKLHRLGLLTDRMVLTGAPGRGYRVHTLNRNGKLVYFMNKK